MIKRRNKGDTPAESFYRRHFTAGTTIYAMGEQRDMAYYVIQGEVVILAPEEDGDERILARLGPGEIFGEMAVIDHGARSATARATTYTVCGLITQKRINELLERAEPALRAFLRTLVSRLRTTNRALTGTSADAFGDVPGPQAPTGPHDFDSDL